MCYPSNDIADLHILNDLDAHVNATNRRFSFHSTAVNDDDDDEEEKEEEEEEEEDVSLSFFYSSIFIKMVCT